MSTLALPLTQPREVTRRRLSLRRVVVNQNPAPNARREAAAPSAMATVKSAVARLEALVRDNRGATAAAHAAAHAAPAPAAEAVPLEALMRGATTLPILHNGEVYTLRKTRYGKLILTK
ncbi:MULTISPECIES: hemin uptake protein HemP [Cupriavidus]|uniref:hemin uptake protein HemP n=1 Tax=Cupriavidus TaxID=106589 RepID=UPI0005BA7AD5|nr:MULTISPECIES: hemin uptake protein HemP [Cupriavidus]MCD9122624.1 hemin uptake protein HemP [Cupriavidus sp. UGS-1]